MTKSKILTHPMAGRVLESPKHKNERRDSWSNLVTLMGTSADKRTQSVSQWDYHPPGFYEQVYAGGGIPARIVDIVPDHCLRNWVDWVNVDGEDEKEEIEERCLELDLRTKFLNTWKWGRAYGGACLHIVTDTNDPASPLRRGEKVLALRDLSRWDLRILTTDIEYDFGSPNYGHPRQYYLNVQMGSQYKGYPIHWTRMIRFDGQLVPRRTFILNNYWHDSILNRVYNSIRNYETSNDAVAAMLQDFNTDIYTLKNLAAMIGAGKESIVKARIEMMNYTKSAINAMMLDADNESYENKQKSVEGIAELLGLQANRLVADTDIPHTILLGESPDGSNATGNSTSQGWYNFLTAEQEHVIKPKLNRLIDIVFPDRASKKKKLRFSFRPLRVLDAIEESNVRKTIAETDHIYIDDGVLDPSEVTESRFGGDEYSMETIIDQDARDAGEIGPGSADYPDGDDDPSEKEEGNFPADKPGKKPQEGKSPAVSKKDIKDIKAKKKDAGEATSVDFGMSEFEPRNVELPMGKKDPKIKTFIGQTESLPMRDPDTDPKLKGPGIPNKPRTILPTRGNGVTAQSGFDFIEDAGKSGTPLEGLAIDEPADKKRKNAFDSERPVPTRAATIIVKKGDSFLMGKRRDNGRWSLPGGHVDDGESHHAGAVRELSEETGLKASRLGFLGGRMVEPKQGQSVHVNIYQHHADDDAKPSGKKDPDKEFSEFRWLSTKDELPEDIAGNLQHPNNVALQHLGLLK